MNLCYQLCYLDGLSCRDFTGKVWLFDKSKGQRVVKEVDVRAYSAKNLVYMYLLLCVWCGIYHLFLRFCSTSDSAFMSNSLKTCTKYYLTGHFTALQALWSATSNLDIQILIQISDQTQAGNKFFDPKSFHILYYIISY